MDLQPAANITVEDFARVDVRLGRVVAAEPLAGARKPAYKLRIDFGPEIGIKGSSAQLTERYTPDDLIGRLVLGVVNLPPRRVAGFNSEALTLGMADHQGGVVLLSVDPAYATHVPLGARMY
ncbi:MAG: tRNA-binding protein [Ktedonobacterales bacterium]